MKSVKPEAVGFSSERLSLVDLAMKEHIDQNRFPGIVTIVARRGEIVHSGYYGYMDLETKKPMKDDTVFRLASMTKPITSTALMILYERGFFQLFDPVSNFIPEFKDLGVFAGIENDEIKLVDAERQITIGDLLTFVSGMMSPWPESPGFNKLIEKTPLSIEGSLDEAFQNIMNFPLENQPGKKWNYGYEYIILTKLIEVLSNSSFSEFLHKEIFEPIGMENTAFYFSKEKANQIPTAYNYSDASNPEVGEPAEKLLTPPPHASGGGNLVSSTADYFRFAQMLLNKGELEGKRILSPKTVEFMTSNHLSKDFLPYGPAANVIWHGLGFGLGMRVVLDVPQTQIIGSPGEYGWAGALSTYFWIDPKEELIGIFMSQVYPPYYWPNLVPTDFKTLVYQAIVG